MRSTKLILMFGMVIGFCGASASNASAQCGPQLKNKQPGLAFSIQGKEDRVTEQKESIESAADASSIVGLWDVQFLVDGQVVDEGFDQYHSDGTEVLNDTPPPAAGSVCLGVYVKTGKRSIKLKHPSWIYDATNTTVIGRATILENITLDPSGNSFTGTFILQLRDLMGNPLAPDAPGQLKGDRIVPD